MSPAWNRGPGRGGWLARLLNPRLPVRTVPGGRTRTLTGADIERPRPLSTQRIGDDLARRGYRFRIDDDGDVTGTWDGNRFWFLLLGEHDEILQVRGRWAGTLPPGSRLAVLQAANDWNRERIWPKVYTREEASGLALYAEVSVDFEHGATEDQLAQTVSCGLVTASQFFSTVASLAPPDGHAEHDPDDPDEDPGQPVTDDRPGDDILGDPTPGDGARGESAGHEDDEPDPADGAK
ncbi:YbjN domain-containing protein [Antribacter soli]|uniref:YbjN domain-containing protein n=1 Tax=Antribacter soli TaxID=2910976 RepID=UPI0027E02E1A|nr:YbjN domain-containing protein [Antribacter soli]